MTRVSSLALASILILFAAAGALRINDLSLYTDSTRYVIWATSLANGEGWLDATQPDPEAYVVNAPFYPVFLIPSQWLSPMSLPAAKWMTLGYGVLAVALFFLLVRRMFSIRTSLTLTCLLASVPLTLVMFTEVLSEAPFFVLAFIALLLVEKDEDRPLRVWEQAAFLTCVLLLPLVREVAITLVGAVALYLALRRRWPVAILTAAAGLLGIAVWTYRNLALVGIPDSSQSANVQFIFEHFVTPASAPIWQEWVQRISSNLRAYRYELTGMIVYPFPLNLIQNSTGAFVILVGVINAVKPFIGFIFVPMVILGVWADFQRSRTAPIRATFGLFYLATVLLYPLQDIRFFLPLLPFVLLYLARAAQTFRLSAVLRWRFGVAVAIILLLPNLAALIELIRSNSRYASAVEVLKTSTAGFDLRGYYATPWGCAGDLIEARASADAVIASAAKEIVPFVGGRKVLEINRAVPLPMFESMLRSNDVSIIVSQQVRSGVQSYEFQLPESKRFRFEEIGTAGWLSIYRVHYVLRDGVSPGLARKDSIQNPIQALLHEGRKALLTYNFELADSLFARARTLDPANAEIAFQRVVLAAFAGTLDQTVAAQKELFSTPRSTSYIPPGRALLNIAEIRNAGRQQSGSALAQSLYIASRTALDIGYPRHARTFVEAALAADPQDFESLLWAMHQAFQSGDTLAARKHLRTLRSIDASNAVVRGFTEIDSLHAEFKKARSPATRANLHLAISRVYERIGLLEESMDSADRAWRDNEPAARLRIAEVLRNMGRTFGAKRMAVRY